MTNDPRFKTDTVWELPKDLDCNWWYNRMEVHISKWAPKLFWKQADLWGLPKNFWIVSPDVWEMMKLCKDEIDLAALWRLCNERN